MFTYLLLANKMSGWIVWWMYGGLKRLCICVQVCVTCCFSVLYACPSFCGRDGKILTTLLECVVYQLTTSPPWHSLSLLLFHSEPLDILYSSVFGWNNPSQIFVCIHSQWMVIVVFITAPLSGGLLWISVATMFMFALYAGNYFACVCAGAVTVFIPPWLWYIVLSNYF